MAKLVDSTELELKEIAAAQAALDERKAVANKRKELQEDFEEFAKKKKFKSSGAFLEFLSEKPATTGKRGRPPGSKNKKKKAAKSAKAAAKSTKTKAEKPLTAVALKREADVTEARQMKKEGKAVAEIMEKLKRKKEWVYKYVKGIK